MELLPPAVLVAILGVLGVVVWYLLTQKDKAQEEKIQILFTKHDEDSRALHEFRVEIAKLHYQKPELDVKFVKIEEAIEKSMDKLGTKFDTMSVILNHLTTELISHIKKEDGK